MPKLGSIVIMFEGGEVIQYSHSAMFDSDGFFLSKNYHHLLKTSL